METAKVPTTYTVTIEQFVGDQLVRSHTESSTCHQSTEETTLGIMLADVIQGMCLEDYSEAMILLEMMGQIPRGRSVSLGAIYDAWQNEDGNVWEFLERVKITPPAAERA